MSQFEGRPQFPVKFQHQRFGPLPHHPLIDSPDPRWQVTGDRWGTPHRDNGICILTCNIFNEVLNAFSVKRKCQKCWNFFPSGEGSGTPPGVGPGPSLAREGDGLGDHFSRCSLWRRGKRTDLFWTFPCKVVLAFKALRHCKSILGGLRILGKVCRSGYSIIKINIKKWRKGAKGLNPVKNGFLCFPHQIFGRILNVKFANDLIL